MGASGDCFDPRFLRVARPLHAAHGREMAPLLYALARFTKPRRVLEVSAGYTSLWLRRRSPMAADCAMRARRSATAAARSATAAATRWRACRRRRGGRRHAASHCVGDLSHKHDGSPRRRRPTNWASRTWKLRVRRTSSRPPLARTAARTTTASSTCSRSTLSGRRRTARRLLARGGRACGRAITPAPLTCTNALTRGSACAAAGRGAAGAGGRQPARRRVCRALLLRAAQAIPELDIALPATAERLGGRARAHNVSVNSYCS